MRRQAFTLIELLVTMAIIGILLSMMVGAVWVAQETARAEQTRGMIAKLHNVLIERWEEYRTRRVSLHPSASPVPGTRLLAIRDLMRMEMPDRYDDLYFSSASPYAIIDRKNDPDTATPPDHKDPGLRTTYLRRINAARGKYNAANGTTWGNSASTPEDAADQFIQNVLGLASNENQSAECLHLIIMASMPADERVTFKHKEYADTNANFMPEFLDAWGTPIRFLRWAPGVVSDVQIHNPVDYHDPFDPYGISMGQTSASINRQPPPTGAGESVPPEWGYATLPYIYSAGADRQFGIFQVNAPPATALERSKNRNPYSRYDDGSGNFLWRGEPVPGAGGDIVNYDNIHNHQGL